MAFVSTKCFCWRDCYLHDYKESGVDFGSVRLFCASRKQVYRSHANFFRKSETTRSFEITLGLIHE